MDIGKEMASIDTLAISDNLIKAGLSGDAAKELANQFRILTDRIDSNITKEEADERLASASALKITELALKKDIETVRLTLEKDIEEVRLTLGRDIEEVRLTLGREIEEVRLTLGREIEEVRLTLGKEIVECKNSMLRFILGSTIATITILGFLIQLG